mgnify:CR=1 FL=1
MVCIRMANTKDSRKRTERRQQRYQVSGRWTTMDALKRRASDVGTTPGKLADELITKYLDDQERAS